MKEIEQRDRNGLKTMNRYDDVLNLYGLSTAVTATATIWNLRVTESTAAIPWQMNWKPQRRGTAGRRRGNVLV